MNNQKSLKKTKKKKKTFAIKNKLLPKGDVFASLIRGLHFYGVKKNIRGIYCNDNLLNLFFLSISVQCRKCVSIEKFSLHF